jgi:hypothetical protein
MEVFEMDGPWQGNPSGYVHHDAWWGFLHLLPFVLLLVLIGVGFWAVLRYSSRPLMAAGTASGTGGVGAPARDAAVEELRIRYARGELGRDDFAHRGRRGGLGGGGRRRPPTPSASWSSTTSRRSPIWSARLFGTRASTSRPPAAAATS